MYSKHNVQNTEQNIIVHVQRSPQKKLSSKAWIGWFVPWVKYSWSTVQNAIIHGILSLKCYSEKNMLL